MRTYNVNQIFYSLQGEGAETGRPAVFIRFAGCNLACPFCDTDFHTYTTLTAAEIVARATEHPARHAILTGGEPTLQADTALVDALHRAGFTVAIETNGTQPLPRGLDRITVSPKPWGRVVLQQADEVKVVYTGQPVEHYMAEIRASRYSLQPCSRIEADGRASSNLRQVIDYCLAHPRWCLSLQTHKLIGIE